MQFDIETVIQDNIRLKKSLHLTKNAQEKTQKQFKQLQEQYDQSVQRLRTLNQQYCELQRKYQNQYTESYKDNNSLIAQIQQLKDIVEEKQRDLERMQIKLIPSLDQDMLRVKLIAQMEGPYQQTVDKKDKQISKLKDKVSELSRKLQISQLSLTSKLSSSKKELQETKKYYQSQNDNLLAELNLSLSRNQVKSVQAGILKSQKKEIDELRANLSFMQQTHQELQMQHSSIKKERNQLIQKLNLMNENQALLIQHKNSRSEMQRLKEDTARFQNQLIKVRAESQKLERKLQSADQQKRKLTNDYQKQLNDERISFSKERATIQSQISELKDQIRRHKSFKIDQQKSVQTLQQNIKILEKKLQYATQEYQKLQYSRRSQTPECWDAFCGGKHKHTNIADIHQSQESRKQNIQKNYEVTRKQYIQKHYEESNKKNQKHRNQETRRHQENNSITYNTSQTHENNSRNKGKKNQYKKGPKRNEVQNDIIYEDQGLRKENQKLKKKLAEANSKIVQLLRDKVRRSPSKKLQPQRDRIKSNIAEPSGVFLEYEDCSFKPLVEPTLYTYNKRTQNRY